MEQRVKQLRKTLNMSQAKFGAALGVSRDVINNIERGRNKTPMSEMQIKHICSTFNVNEQWLRTGEEPMFVDKHSENQLNVNMTQFSAAALQLIKEFYALSPEEQKKFIDNAEQLFSSNNE